MCVFPETTLDFLDLLQTRPDSRPRTAQRLQNMELMNKGEYGPLNPILFSPQKKACARLFPTSSHRQPVRVAKALRIGPGAKARRGASLGDVPLASGQARQQQTSSVACDEFAVLSFVLNEPLECTLPVQERFHSTSTRCEAGLLPSLRARLAIQRWRRHPRTTVHPLPLTFGYVHDRIAFISLHHSHTPDCSRSQIYHQPR